MCYQILKLTVEDDVVVLGFVIVIQNFNNIWSLEHMHIMAEWKCLQLILWCKVIAVAENLPYKAKQAKFLTMYRTKNPKYCRISHVGPITKKLQEKLLPT